MRHHTHVKRGMDTMNDMGPLSGVVKFFPGMALVMIMIGQGLIKGTYRQLSAMGVICRQCFEEGHHVFGFDIPTFGDAYSFCHMGHCIGTDLGVQAAVHLKCYGLNTIFADR